MGTQRLATVTMPFEMWRILLHRGQLTPDMHLLGHQAVELVQIQLEAQTIHANCDTPKTSIVHSRLYPDRYLMKVVCSCGEILTSADNIPPETLERIGPRGAYRPKQSEA